ncbi:MAG TPA: YbdD/YjiX family protein [Gemmatimonadaceae bacterium]|nr:YbdD/YjiX family protein [Gemmatimonadaceae bacterium]
MSNTAGSRRAGVPGDRPGARRLLERVGATVRRIIGAPDYDAYVVHVRTHHPGREPLCEREFIEERLKSRYEKPGSRCC